jgi:hypothetical protein
MVKYGTRHHAHADCLLKAKGADAFKSLSTWQLEWFPYFAISEAGLTNELRNELAARKVKP